jgi:hypothetical protein
MTTTRSPRRSLAAAFAVAVLLGVGGCGQPSEEARQNRRVVDAVLTAVTTKNRKQLDKDAVLWDERFAGGLVSTERHKAVKDCIAKARTGDWAGAEDALYKFRESDPFPK